MSNYSLLVADDEEIPRRHILEDISWDTLNIRPLYQASTGWEALALLLKHQPDILILDIRMPGLSGLQLLDELRIDQTRGPDDPVPLEEPGPEPPSFHENAQPRGSKVLLIQQVKEYLQENYTQRITLNSAAALVYLTPTYLSKLFAEVEGMGFSEYLSALRIQHAKEALLDYHRRIYEIAAQVGYQDVKHFMKVFKKQVGMTPREYRESHLF